ncbi:MAG TPA: hypothetical protein VK675_00750 [Candidatus Paceibacterota bacterium]|nr:hypothetical protein [Candidatus Paceibacterota bacterium]
MITSDFLIKNFSKLAGAGFVLCALVSPGTTAFASNSKRADTHSLFVTMSNDSSNNALLVYSADATLVASYPTGGAGGASGNGGSVQVFGNKIYVPDFGSKDVAIFAQKGKSFDLLGRISTASAPVSVTIGAGHVYVLETDRVESFKVSPKNTTATGSVALLIGDGSAGAIGYLSDGHVIYTEKSGTIAQIATKGGAVTGESVAITGIPDGLSVPLGLDTTATKAVVTNAHGDAYQEMLIEKGRVVSTTLGPGTFTLGNADCWNAFYRQNLVYSSNSPAHQIDLFEVDRNSIELNKTTVATFEGAPTDLAVSSTGLLGVIYGKNISTFKINTDGSLTEIGTSETASTMNGAAWIK